MIESNHKLIKNTEKIYPSSSRLVVYKRSFPVATGPRENKKGKKMLTELVKNQLLQLSLNRTKITVKDIVLCNKFDLFCTFTFKDHRTDIDICKARMQHWLKSQQKIHGTFDYLIVPEFHKDGQALHFHALLNGFKGKLTPAISSKTGKPIVSKNNFPIYNIDGWRSGFAEAAIIEQNQESLGKVANYVTKYITKDMPVFHGKKRYWVSQGLHRPIKNNNVDDGPYLGDDNVQIIDNEHYTIYVVDKTHKKVAKEQSEE